MLAQFSIVDGIEYWSTTRGQWCQWMPEPSVFCSRAIGRITLELAPVIITTSTRIINKMRPHVFADWGEMTGYDAQVRQQMTPWVQQMLPSTRSWNLLVEKAMVSMAINVANLELGGSIRVFTDRAEFEAALAEAIADLKTKRAEPKT